LFLSFLINTHKFTIAQPITCNHRKRRDEHSVTMNSVWWQKGKRFQLPKSYRVMVEKWEDNAGHGKAGKVLFPSLSFSINITCRLLNIYSALPLVTDAQCCLLPLLINFSNNSINYISIF
jgi:hypothetical protein